MHCAAALLHCCTSALLPATEEFEDPLLGGVMRDPVRLPSGMVVERASIVQHLLTDKNDPYT